MRLYLDTEFNGHGGELISMALVSNYGHLWYYAKHSIDGYDPWVAEHVLPKIDVVSFLDPDVFCETFQRWIKQFDNPEIICDYFADAIHFLSLLAGPTYNTSLDYPCRIIILKTPPGQPVSTNLHNALADAIALRDWHTEMLRNEECP